jgi:hypothetical protein
MEEDPRLMSYSLYDTAQGPVLHLASVGGMVDLLDFVERFPKFGPLSNFLTMGETNDVKGVLAEVTQLIPYCTDPNVRSTMENLKQGLEKVKGEARIIE